MKPRKIMIHNDFVREQYNKLGLLAIKGVAKVYRKVTGRKCPK